MTATDPATGPAQPGPAAGPARTPRRAGGRWLGRAAAPIVVVLLALAGCTFGDPPPDQSGEPPRLPSPTGPPSRSTDPSGAVTVLAEGLDVPWGIAFLPDGAALVTERNTGRIVKLGPGRGEGSGLAATPVQTVPGVKAGGEGGLLGIAVSPNYAADSTVFVYYTTDNDNRIARFTLGAAPRPILTGIPAGGIHNGGRIAFGPDGFLYASTGETGDRSLAQDRNSLAGKILRMTADGKPAPGNPFPDSVVWSYGHRNIEGLAWSDAKRLYATEFGASEWDEVNLIEPGRNYGWPAVEGRGNDSRYTNPLVTWPTAEASCAGAAVLQTTLVAACLRGERLYLIQLTGTGGVLGAPQPILTGTYGRLRTVVAAPDGTLWVTTSNKDGRGDPQPGDDKILRLVLEGSGSAGNT